MLRQGDVGVWRVADTEEVAGGAVETPARQKVLTDAGFRRCQLFNEILLSCSVGFENSSARTNVALGAAVFVGECEIDLLSDSFDRFLECEVFEFLEESEDIATLAATEAVVIPGVGPDVKTRRLFVVKRAQALKRINAGAAECNVKADYIGNIGARSNLVNV